MATEAHRGSPGFSPVCLGVCELSIRELAHPSGLPSMWGVGLGRELSPRPSVAQDAFGWFAFGDVLCDPLSAETTVGQELGELV